MDVPIKFKKDINLDIDENATIDLSGVTVNTPTIVVSANIKNGEDNSAQLVVPVKDNNGTKIGEAKIAVFRCVESLFATISNAFALARYSASSLEEVFVGFVTIKGKFFEQSASMNYLC